MNVNLSGIILYTLNQVYSHKGNTCLYLQKNDKRELVTNCSPGSAIKFNDQWSTQYDFFLIMCSFSYGYLFVVSTSYQLTFEKN